MRLWTVLIALLTLVSVGHASAQPASASNVDDLELIKQLRRREAALRKELVIDFTVTKSLLPGYEERETLKRQALEAMYERGVFREKPEYHRSVFYTPDEFEPKACTVGVRGREVRVDYDDEGFAPLHDEPGHNTVYSNGKVLLGYRDPPYRGTTAGHVDTDQTWDLTDVLALQAAGLCVYDPLRDSLDTSASLSDFFERARAEGRLEAVKEQQPGGEAESYVLTGYVASEESPGWFMAARAFLDPERKCAPVRIEWGARKQTEEGHVEELWSARLVDVELSDVGDGIWFPKRANLVLSKAEPVPDPDRPQKEWDSRMFDVWNLALVVSAVHVHGSPPGYRFKFRFPWGTEVHDERTGKTYTVGIVSLVKSPLVLSIGGLVAVMLVALVFLRARRHTRG